MSLPEELAARLLTASHALHGRTEELRRTLQARVAQLRVQIVPPPPELSAQPEKLRDELARIEQLLAETRAEMQRLSAEIVDECRALGERLLPAARARIALRSRTALHDRVREALSAFRGDLDRLSIRVDTNAQQEAALPMLTDFAEQRRDQLSEAFAMAGSRAAELSEAQERVRDVRDRTDGLNQRERELLTQLGQHLHPEQNGNSLVGGILSADERTAIGLRKYLLQPLLDDLHIERGQGLYDTDPLETLERLMREGA